MAFRPAAGACRETRQWSGEECKSCSFLYFVEIGHLPDNSEMTSYIYGIFHGNNPLYE